MFKKVQIAHKEYTVTQSWATQWEAVLRNRFVGNKRVIMSSRLIATVRELYASAPKNVTNPKGLLSAMAKELQCNGEYIRPVGVVLYKRSASAPRKMVIQPEVVDESPVLVLDIVKAELNIVQSEIDKVVPRLSYLQAQRNMLESIIKRAGDAK